MSSETVQVLKDPADAAGSSALSALMDIRPLYFLPADPLAEEVLGPVDIHVAATTPATR